MNHNLLLCEINSVQRHYQRLLLNLLPYLSTSNALEVLDEINIFWSRHMQIVRLYLETVPRYDAYVFTGVTRLDFGNYEHLPFLLFCDKAILDDPLSRYSQICKELPGGKHQEDFKNQIFMTITDNLKVLTNLGDSLLVLPFRLLNQSTCQQLNNQCSLIEDGQKFFVHLFQGIENFDEYFKKCSNLADIQKHLRVDVEKILKLTESDDQSQPLEKRFRNAVSQTKFFIDSNDSDAINFFRLVYGNLQQAVDIVYSCEVYQCIPYIRYPVTFHYVSWLLQNMLEEKQFLWRHFKMIIPLISHHYADREKLASVPIEKFLIKRKAYNFSQMVYNRLENAGINEQNFDGGAASIELVKEELNSFYNFLTSD